MTCWWHCSPRSSITAPGPAVIIRLSVVHTLSSSHWLQSRHVVDLGRLRRPGPAQPSASARRRYRCPPCAGALATTRIKSSRSSRRCSSNDYFSFPRRFLSVNRSSRRSLLLAGFSPPFTGPNYNNLLWAYCCRAVGLCWSAFKYCCFITNSTSLLYTTQIISYYLQRPRSSFVGHNL